MEIDLNQIITGIGKKPFRDDEGKELTLKRAILMGLTATPDSRTTRPTPEECSKLSRLFEKIDEAESKIELKSDEVVRLKEIISNRIALEMLAGKIIRAIEPDRD